MKFLIQKINGEIRHDFVYVLMESIRFRNWLQNAEKIKYRFFDTTEDGVDFKFKPLHRHYVPVGTVEFVSSFINHFYGLTPKPMNVPWELRVYPLFSKRRITDCTDVEVMTLKNTVKLFVKSNDKIKGYSEIIDTSKEFQVPAGNYQISDYLTGIESEWRAFVYNDILVGLQNYCGEFTLFPNPETIKNMIKAFKSAPIAYTLDVGVRNVDYYQKETIIIEAHDFFSCGLYGFSNLAIYPQMLHRWFWQYIQREMVNQKLNTL